jgi:hypothetical protein
MKHPISVSHETGSRPDIRPGRDDSADDMGRLQLRYVSKGADDLYPMRAASLAP